MQKRMGGKDAIAKILTSGSKELFHQELSLLSMYQGHPNIAQVIGYVDDLKLMFMIYYPVGSLDNFLKQPLTMIVAHQILKDVASGLFSLHTNGIVHNDIKPANVLIDKDLYGRLTARITG